MHVKKLTPKDTPAVIGYRVKSARMLSGHSRQSFAAESRISMATLRAWEEPTEERKGLTRKGASRLVNSLREMGIYCTEDWLFNSDGPGPKILSTLHNNHTDNNDTIDWGEEESILKDIDSFKSNNPNPVVAIITDGSMIPRYSYGDYVGGSKLFGNDMSSLVGSDCIIETKDKAIIRRLTSFSSGLYTLVALNLDASIPDAIISNVKLESAAEIIWHRWRTKTQNIIV